MNVNRDANHFFNLSFPFLLLIVLPLVLKRKVPLLPWSQLPGLGVDH